MKTYITRTGQNIYDIALQLYGSLEGIMDLIVCNTSLKVADFGPKALEGRPLSFATSISRGIELQYHDGIVINNNIKEYINEKELIPTNGEHTCNAHAFYMSRKRILINQRGDICTIAGTIQEGTMYIDWGDFSDVTTASKTDGDFLFEHIYKSDQSHTVTIMGDFVMEDLDISQTNGLAYPVSVIKITKKFTNNNKIPTLNKLFKIHSAL